LRIDFRRSITVVLALLLTFAALAQVRGKGRLQGFVTDKATQKPIANANVTISNGATKPLVTKTNARGQWSAIGLTSGSWSVDIEADGYQTLRGTATLSESQMVPPIRSELEAAETTVPMEPESSNVPQEVVDAVNEAQDLLHAAPGDEITKADGTTAIATADDVRANSRKAAEMLEAALPEIPGDSEERKAIRSQIQQVLAQAQYKAGNIDRAIATLEPLVTADSPNPGLTLLLVNLYLEAGKLSEGKALLEKVPAVAISDPNVYTNVGILFLNKDSAADAIQYFDKAIALDPNNAATYYYRGLANVHLKKAAEAKADLEKVIALAPDGPEAKDARQLLAGLK
jgi:Flp pilus assembly protein TadD